MSTHDETTDGAPGDAAAPEGERIAKTIARAGIASRRDAEAMIEAGRVTLNGQVLASPAINVTDSDRITVDGEPLPARERTRLWILHKPRGVVTTARDPEGRQTVFDGLPPDLPRVVAIGRLDINTEGLLLLTNDGGLAKVIAHPETGWLRRYRVRAFGDVTQPDLDRLRKGVSIEGMDYGPVEASLDRAQGDNVWLTLGLREGKNREVKRILEHLGLSVNRLIRLSFGPFQLGDLEVGLVEEVRTKVLKEQLGKNLSEQAGVDFESPVREPIAPFGSPRKKAAQPAMAAKPPRTGPSARGEVSRGGDRPPGRERPGGVRAPRDPARPPVPARVPTGGMGPGPRSSIWRAEDAETRPHGTRIPRRGGDPKAARATAAERGRERVGAITTGERRVVVERLQPSPEAPPSEPHRRVRFRTHDEAAPRRIQGERPPRRDRDAGGDGAARGPARSRPPRDDNREGGGARGPFRPERGAGDERGTASRGGARPFRAPRGDRPAQDRPAQGRPAQDRPTQDRSGQGRPVRDRPRSDRPEEGRGDRPGGFKGGRPEGRAGGFKDGRPGGGRPGGFKGGKPGGRPGGAGPGSRGSKPGGAGSGGFKGGKSGGKSGGRPGGGKPGPRGGR